MGKAKHLIVISEDAMVYEDLQTLRQLPSFGSIWDKCAFVDRVRSVYPGQIRVNVIRETRSTEYAK